MKNFIRSCKGVTLVSLTVTIIVLMILTGTIIYNLQDSLKLQNLKNMQNDISNLRDLVSNYYSLYGEIPANRSIEYDITGKSIASSGIISRATDTGSFYVIDLQYLDNLTLNYGRDYENYKQIVGDSNQITSDIINQVNELTDIYIINGDSQNIFYVSGVTINNNTYYTDYSVDDVDKQSIDLIEIPEKPATNELEDMNQNTIQEE